MARYLRATAWEAPRCPTTALLQTCCLLAPLQCTCRPFFAPTKLDQSTQPSWPVGSLSSRLRLLGLLTLACWFVGWPLGQTRRLAGCPIMWLSVVSGSRAPGCRTHTHPPLISAATRLTAMPGSSPPAVSWEPRLDASPAKPGHWLHAFPSRVWPLHATARGEL